MPDITNQVKITYDPNQYTWLDVYACDVEVNEFRNFYERRTDTPPRCKQQIIEDFLFYQNLTVEEKQVYDQIKHEQKMAEMEVNRAEVFYTMTLTREEYKVYRELKEEDRNTKYKKAINKHNEIYKPTF